MGLGLVIHELATNATKFGALSVATGELAIEWSIDGAGGARHLDLTWTESRGPPAREPETRGFGSVMIEREICHELSGEVDLEYRADGLHFGLVAVAPGAAEAERKDPGTMSDLRGVRFLVVEDDALVAFDLEAILTAAGCTVLGPVGDVEHAVQVATQASFEAALLDIHLRGEMVYPVADILIGRGVPFMFLTGYDLQDLPSRFRQRPLSRKPYSAASLLAKLAEMLARPGRDPGA